MSRPKRYTERVRFTVPTETKRRLEAEARELGVSLSAHMRDKVDEFIARDELLELMSQLAPKDALHP